MNVSVAFPSPQMLAADPKTSVFVTANAGSGKTSTLVQRVARLLLHGAKPEALLCVTYTKAAAAEMQDRLFETLGRWSVLDDGALTEELERIGERPDNLSLARTLFARALETPGGLKIQTIHAFCEKLLRRFPLEAGVSPGFQVLEDAAARDVSTRARNDLARAALADPEGPIGRAYAHFAVDLDLRTFEGLFAAFESERAAIRAYVERREGDLASDVWRVCGFSEVGDLDALAAEAARACDFARWADAASTLLASSPKDVALGEKLARVCESAKANPPNFAECLAVFTNGGGGPPKTICTQKIAAHIKAWLQAECDRLHAACAQVRAARVARDTVYALALAITYDSLYEQAKRETGALDFADLIALTERLLTQKADAAWVLYKLDGGIDHVLVDEAQDTAPEQWEILHALTGEFFAGAGKRGLADRTVFAVGDEKQSIYSFQGAAPERLGYEREAYSALVTHAGRDFLGVELTTSWRSTGEVLRFTDAVFADPATRTAVPPAPGEDEVKHITGRVDHHGCVDLWPPFVESKGEEPDAWDAPLDAEPVEGARKRLARRIASWIVEAGRRGEAVYDKQAKAWRAVRPGDVLILVRRRDALFEEIIRALKKAGVPVAGADRLRLSEHIVFQDVLLLCRFVLFPDDDLSLAEVLRSPFCDVPEEGEGSLMALALGRGGTLWCALRERRAEHPAWAAAADLLDALKRDARALEPFDWLARTLNRLDRNGRSMRQRILTRLGREAEDALDELMAQALRLESQGVRELERFAAALERSDVEVKRELDTGAGEVRVMTVHGAKGLEAPVVILPDTATKAPPGRGVLLRTEDGGFLLAPRKTEDCDASTQARDYRERKTQQEAMRLLYVALTRARDRLIVCGRLAANAKEAVEGCWYKAVECAFERREIAEESRTLADGDLQVRRFGPDPQLASREAKLEAAASGLPAWAAAPAAPEPANEGYAAPSDAAARRRGPAPSPLGRTAGLGHFRRGNLIHRLLQLLPDLPSDAREAAATRLLDKERDLTPDQRAEMAGAALALLADPQFAEVFGPGSRAEAAVAGSAPELPSGMAISGRVDRMTVTRDRVLVVDFKTNRPSPKRVEDADPAYLTQMAIYVAVLHAVFPGKRVEAALVWTDGPKLMPVPEALIGESLARLESCG